MVLMAESGSFAPPVRSCTTLNVSLVTQNNKSMPKDGHLPAHSMSVKEKESKQGTLSTNNPEYPRSINWVTNWVTKKVTIFELCYCRKMAKTKFLKKGKGGKTLQTPEQKRKAMSHKGRRNQMWKEKQMDRAEELWQQNKDNNPKDRLSMRTIAEMCSLSKTTVIERLSGHHKCHGHIAGEKGSPDCCRKVSKQVSKWVKITVTVTVLTEVSNGSGKWVILLQVNTTFDFLLLGIFLAFCNRTRK